MGSLPELAKRAYEFGPFSLDVKRRLMLKSDQVVPLTSKAFETLLALVQNHSRVVDKDELLKQIWPDTVVEERNLAVNISILRKVLGESPESHDYIVTIPGRGYRFVAPVRELVSADNPGAGAAEVLPPIRLRLGRRQALLGSGVLAVLIVVFAMGRYSNLAPARPALRFSTVTNFAGVEGQPAISPDGRVAFVSDRSGQYDIWVGLLSGGSLVRITNDANVESRPRWSPDTTKLLYARLNESGLWDVWVVPALGGSARKLVSNAADPTWSPDGRWIAYANLATGSIWICDAAGREPRALTQPEDQARHRQPAFSRDGRRVAFARRSVSGGPPGELALAEVGSHKWLPLTDDGAFAGSPAWSPDGSFIYFASGRGGAINIWKVGARGGRPEQITVGPGDDAELDVSSDGQRIVFSSYRVNINLEEISIDDSNAPHWRLAERKWLTSDAARGELAPAYSPDGKRIAYFTNRRGAEREAIWVMQADGSNPVQVIEDERVNVYPRWTRDGQSLIYASRLTGVGLSRPWDQLDLRRILLSGGVPQKMPFQVANPMGDVAARDQLLYRGVNGSVAIFDLNTNQTQTLKDVAGTYLRWCPDGRRFAAVVYPREEKDPSAGVWVYDLEGKRRHVFVGWSPFYAWAGANELLILEGKPDLNAILWRVRLDGSPMLNIGSIRLIYSYWHSVLLTRFDVHPDGRRLVAEALELHQADVSMIENIK